MSEDWQPGDLAMLVRKGKVRCDCGGDHFHSGVVLGDSAVREVAWLMPENEDWLGEVCRSLVVYFTDGSAGLALRFRKIRPHTPDAEDAETIRLLTGTPVREPV